ncbi:hypothetical protein PMAC_000472 [Pneumocystis sp. 'macacae']|nr:hypothetical protein PMAC_000472 [Pneumocystis sp. 'macacae']
MAIISTPKRLAGSKLAVSLERSRNPQLKVLKCKVLDFRRMLELLSQKIDPLGFLLENLSLPLIKGMGYIVHWEAEVFQCVKDCYLVDPASSHMLVSKIKPCMSNYSLFDKLIHAKNPDSMEGIESHGLVLAMDRGLPWFRRVTGNKGSIPEREPEKRLPHPRKAAGAQITQSRHGEVVTINNNTGLFWVLASLVPAAAVIPAPIAYIKVAAVKKLVVELRDWRPGPPKCVHWRRRSFLLDYRYALHWVCRITRAFYFEKIRVFKAGICSNTLAWNNEIEHGQLGALVFNCQRLTTAKAFAKDVFINQERKLGDRRRSDTRSGDVFFLTRSASYEKSKSSGSGGSMELTEGHHQEWSLRLNLTQHGETHQLFLDSMGGGAWPFLVGEVISRLAFADRRLLRGTVGMKPMESQQVHFLDRKSIAIIALQRGIPSKRKSSACVDYVPALCTHRPSLLPIEWLSEVFGLAVEEVKVVTRHAFIGDAIVSAMAVYPNWQAIIGFGCWINVRRR